jgi:hypothetical protein
MGYDRSGHMKNLQFFCALKALPDGTQVRAFRFLAYIDQTIWPIAIHQKHARDSQIRIGFLRIDSNLPSQPVGVRSRLHALHTKSARCALRPLRQPFPTCTMERLATRPTLAAPALAAPPTEATTRSCGTPAQASAQPTRGHLCQREAGQPEACEGRRIQAWLSVLRAILPTLAE